MTADGQPACTPAPTLDLENDRLDSSVAQALTVLLGRRNLLKAAAGGLATLMLAACQAQPSAGPTATSAPSSGTTPVSATPASATPSAEATATSQPAANATVQPSTSATPGAKALWVYVFNVGSQDVTIIDTATDKVVATRPLGASVRWLSNEQRYWDGTNIWTYDFPNNKIQAIAIDPKDVKVVKTVETGSTGPAHSLMLTPDKKTAVINSAGSNAVDFIDVATGKVTDSLDTGKFP